MRMPEGRLALLPLARDVAAARATMRRLAMPGVP
jgi:hypothetical protein